MNYFLLIIGCDQCTCTSVELFFKLISFLWPFSLTSELLLFKTVTTSQGTTRRRRAVRARGWQNARKNEYFKIKKKLIICAKQILNYRDK